MAICCGVYGYGMRDHGGVLAAVPDSVTGGPGATGSDRRWRLRFVLAWAFLAVLKVGLAVRLPLFGDEAFYWLEGQHLALAYSDLPMATAWLARLGVELGGPHPLALRLPFLLLGLALPWLLLRIARHLHQDESCVWQTGLLALPLPVLLGSSLLALPDVLLTFAIVLACDATLALLTRVGPGALLRLGVALVLGALSHYRFALPLLLAGFTLLALPRGRALLRRPQVWWALLIGALAWLPLLLWNVRHDAAGIVFQVFERNPWQARAAGWSFIPIQMLLLTPALAIAWAQTAASGWRRWRDTGEARLGFVVLGCGGLLAAWFGLGFFADRERVSFHWPLPAFLPLLALVPARLARWSRAGRALLWSMLLLVALATLTGMAAIASEPGREALARLGLYPENFTGWDAAARAVARARADLPADAGLIADNFMLAAQLSFALHGVRVEVLAHPLNGKHGRATQLRIWGLLRAEGPLPRPAVLVIEDSAVSLKDRLRHYQALCARYGALPPAEVISVDHGRKRFFVYRLRADAELPQRCALPALAWVDAPLPDARLDAPFIVRGWAFKDEVGVRAVDVRVDGQVVARALYDLPAPHVAEYWQVSRDPRHPAVGFAAEIDPTALPPGRHRLDLLIHGNDGSREPWPAQVFIRSARATGAH